MESILSSPIEEHFVKSPSPITSLLFACLSLVVTGIFVCKIFGKKSRTKKTSSLPSPPSLPFIGHALLPAWRGDPLKLMTVMFSKYGKIWKATAFGCDYVFIADANMVRKLLSTNSPHVDKPKAASSLWHMDIFTGDLFTAEGDVWTSQRKVLSKAFTFSALRSYVGLINKNAKALINELTSRPLDFHKLIHNYSLHIITEIVFGPEIWNDQEEYLKFLKVNNRMHELMELRIANLILLLKPLWRIHPAGREMIAVRSEMESIVLKKMKSIQSNHCLPLNNDVLEEIDQNDGEHAPFHSILQTMLKSRVSDEVILVRECIDMMNGGHETVSKSMELLMLHLALNPYHQNRCREEIDQVVEKEWESNSGSDFRITTNSLSELKYLENCIKESGRLTPIAPTIPRVLKTPLKLDKDIELDKDTNVLVSTWTIHRDPDYFYNPKKFDPDRFSPDNRKNIHPYAYLPFSAGKRNCIGLKLAMMELKVFSAWILRHYVVETTDKLEDFTFGFGITIRLSQQINLIFKPRRFIQK